MANSPSKSGTRRPFDLLEQTKERGTHSETRNTLIPKKALNVQTVQTTYFKETKPGLTNSPPSHPLFTTSACHFKLSHHIPLLYRHSQSTVRKAFLAVTAGLCGRSNPATRPHVCISWHNISRQMWQLKATLASSQPSRKREIFSPGWSCTVSFRARLSTHCSDEEVPSLSAHDSTSAFWGNRIPTCLQHQETDYP